jgi:hypothetical protein
MLRIHEILLRIRIRGSIPLTNRSGSCFFRQQPSRLPNPDSQHCYVLFISKLMIINHSIIGCRRNFDKIQLAEHTFRAKTQLSGGGSMFRIAAREIPKRFTKGNLGIQFCDGRYFKGVIKTWLFNFQQQSLKIYLCKKVQLYKQSL